MNYYNEKIKKLKAIKAPYKIQFFYEYGGEMFWARNNNSLLRFGSPINPYDLPISKESADKFKKYCEIWEINMLNDMKKNKESIPLPQDFADWDLERLNNETAILLKQTKRELGAEYDLFELDGYLSKIDKELPIMKEFKVNEYITLKLENNKTVMYINDKLEEYNICCGVLTNVWGDSPSSIEESEESLTSIIDTGQYQSSWPPEIRIKITPEEEFWVYCSNLQVWAENNYNTDLLHYSASIPLLYRLVEIGVPSAKDTFKKEVLHRIKNGWGAHFILMEDYLEKTGLTDEELIRGILDPVESEALLEISKRTEQKYVLGIDFDGEDTIRQRPLYRNLMEPILYFAVDNCHLRELEIELTKENRKIPQELLCFPYLHTLHIWVTDPNVRILQSQFQVKNVKMFRLVMHESVRFPRNLYSIFPNLKYRRIYLADSSVKPVNKS